jgi:hypothetical protein
MCVDSRINTARLLIAHRNIFMWVLIKIFGPFCAWRNMHVIKTFGQFCAWRNMHVIRCWETLKRDQNCTSWEVSLERSIARSLLLSLPFILNLPSVHCSLNTITYFFCFSHGLICLDCHLFLWLLWLCLISWTALVKVEILYLLLLH